MNNRWLADARALALGALLLCRVVLADPAPYPAINLHHTSWTARDGAPALVLSMAQASDGWLWLAAPTGLYRFDGVQFEQFSPVNEPLLTRNVSSVSAFPDGVIWIGYRTGGVGRLQQGRIRNYGPQDGLPARAVWGVEQDSSGRVWTATSLGMYYLDNQRWLAAGSAWNLPAGRYKTLLRDRQGGLWAQGEAGVFSLRPGATRFVRADGDNGVGVLFNLADDSVLSWNAVLGRFHQVAGRAQAVQPPAWRQMRDPSSLLFDRHGDLWVGTREGVEYRTAHGTFQATPAQGLSGRFVGAVFEDREGNVWAATAGGIDRFGRRRLSRIDGLEQAIGGALLADDSGGVWIGNLHVGDIDSGQPKLSVLWPDSRAGWASMFNSFTRTSDGALWGATYRKLRRLQGRQYRDVDLPPEAASVAVPLVLAEPDDSLLVAFKHGLHRRKPDGTWELVRALDNIDLMTRSDAAGLWLGCFDGQLVHADGPVWRSYGAAEGLSLGMLLTLHLHGQHVWAGGETGLALRSGDSFRALHGVNGEMFDGASGIVELDNGELWVNATAGLFRIAGAELARFARDAGYQVRYERLDQQDGLEGVAPRNTSSPSLIRAADGRLWAIRSSGVFRLDPAERPQPGPTLPVIIKAMGAPGLGQPPQEPVRFAAGTASLQIDYTVPALAMPERVRFRYRLDDGAWQDAGSRRSAYFSNLGAGNYLFRVAASDYNGHWPQQETTVAFNIAPAVTETWWFRALCALALLAAARLMYRWQIQRVRRQLANRLQERVGERERIARELHDTLLQSVQGLILHVHAAAVRLPDQDTTRQALENALRQADHVVDEGRGRIRDLRGEEPGKLSFADAIVAAAARLRPDGAPALQLKLDGAARRLDPTIHEEALAIITEAVANAYRHAGARHIAVELHYGTRELRCTVRDDGAGMAPDIVCAGGRDNHWGMRGMHERAERIKAKLSLHSCAANGTEWQLVLPAALAYTR